MTSIIPKKMYAKDQTEWMRHPNFIYIVQVSESHRWTQIIMNYKLILTINFFLPAIMVQTNHIKFIFIKVIAIFQLSFDYWVLIVISAKYMRLLWLPLVSCDILMSLSVLSSKSSFTSSACWSLRKISIKIFCNESVLKNGSALQPSNFLLI